MSTVVGTSTPRAARTTNILTAVPESGLMTVSMAADFLKVSQITLRRYLTQKKLRRFKVGGPHGRTLVKRSDVLNLVKEAR